MKIYEMVVCRAPEKHLRVFQSCEGVEQEVEEVVEYLQILGKFARVYGKLCYKLINIKLVKRALIIYFVLLALL